ncbi:nucleotidyltransferase domain-containing protein [Radiobacillus sp. PE A8.2]|uniref:nucleotidyltransferase domain-containing protein n=1 Tax=Radiobacillus sp. PE A8.2 TaxID=3380349 RepID=UPI00388D663E
MFQHHKIAIETITNKLKTKQEILGIIVGGSVAHGFAKGDSDIDLMLVVSDDDYKLALESGNIEYHETDSTPYKGGYVDGKYTSISYIKKVIESGSEPARYAYKDAFITYSEIPELDTLIHEAAKYPIHKQEENMVKFYAQLEAWRWWFHEGLKREDKYVMDYAAANFVLFAGRLLLAYNKALYPYHKWFTKVLDGVENKPENTIALINDVLNDKTADSIENLYTTVINFYDWPQSDKGWHTRFMLDNELNWLSGHVPVMDL